MQVIMFDFGIAIAKSVQQATALVAIKLMKLPGSSAGKVLEMIEEWEFSILRPDEIDRKTEAVAAKGNIVLHMLSFEF